MVKTYAQLYLDARYELMKQEPEQSASMLARHLLCFVSQKTHEQFIADRELFAPEDVCAAMENVVSRVLAEEPLAYILGEWSFYGMNLFVDKRVLIPRDDTCAVAQLAMKKGLFLDQDPRILDLCTGSGCIGLAVANRVKDARVTLADISPEALSVAKKNVNRMNLSGRVQCLVVDALQKAPEFLGKFHMIVSNPPYIPSGEMEELPESVKNYEPLLALNGGADGLDFYRSIVKNFTSALRPKGYLCFEFGMGQGDDVCKILEEHGYTILERVRDFNDRERAVLAQYDRKEE